MGLQRWLERPKDRDNSERAALWRKHIIESAGGKCSRCGFTPKDLPEYACIDFHHRDPQSKSFNITISAMSRGWEAVREETAKCDLLCANCHRLVHQGKGSRPRKVKVIPFTSTSSEEAGIEEAS
jgi:predicted HNH restriction endonuclease